MRLFFGLLIGVVLSAAEPSWGASDNGLRIGFSMTSGLFRSAIVSLENLSGEPMQLLAGGATGNGPFYSFTFLATNAAGDKCTVINSLGGAGVAGYIEPIVFKLGPGAVEKVQIPAGKLFCSFAGFNLGLEELLASGHSVKVVFKSEARAGALYRLGKLWIGAVESASYRFTGTTSI
jgi:hypothetical protein